MFSTSIKKPQWPLQNQCLSFYGDPRGQNGHYNPTWAGKNLVHVHCPWALYMGTQAIPFIIIHKRCADSLNRILTNIWSDCGQLQNVIDSHKYSEYDGSFNYRPKRGGSSLSMHAFGVAIDWDAQDNQFHALHHLFQSGDIIVKRFEEEGWVWGGRWSSPDAMHFQAARIHP
jgi:hypothetical protein